MKILLNKISFIVLAMFIAVSTIGVSFSKVYCFHKKKNEYSLSFNSNVSANIKCSCKEHEVQRKSSCCKSKKPVKKKCCNNSSVRYVLDSDYDLVSNDFLLKNSFSWMNNHLPVFNNYDRFDEVIKGNFNLRPPPLIERDIPVMFQSFLI